MWNVDMLEQVAMSCVNLRGLLPIAVILLINVIVVIIGQRAE